MMKTTVACVVLFVFCLGALVAADFSAGTGVITLQANRTGANQPDTWTNPSGQTKLVARSILFIPKTASKITTLRDGSATGQILAQFNSGATTATQSISVSFVVPRTLYLASDDATTDGPSLIVYTQGVR
ncbi:MAG: hypothetical protein N2111_13875 [Candidatus Sumerlaeaceae bacterium]|nr:hypothetical protein [Candidatus Sumerlaeaceae bacterium]